MNPTGDFDTAARDAATSSSAHRATNRTYDVKLAGLFEGIAAVDSVALSAKHFEGMFKGMDVSTAVAGLARSFPSKSIADSVRLSSTLFAHQGKAISDSIAGHFIATKGIVDSNAALASIVGPSSKIACRSIAGRFVASERIFTSAVASQRAYDSIVGPFSKIASQSLAAQVMPTTTALASAVDSIATFASIVGPLSRMASQSIAGKFMSTEAALVSIASQFTSTESVLASAKLFEGIGTSHAISGLIGSSFNRSISDSVGLSARLLAEQQASVLRFDQSLGVARLVEALCAAEVGVARLDDLGGAEGASLGQPIEMVPPPLLILALLGYWILPTLLRIPVDVAEEALRQAIFIADAAAALDDGSEAFHGVVVLAGFLGLAIAFWGLAHALRSRN